MRPEGNHVLHVRSDVAASSWSHPLWYTLVPLFTFRLRPTVAAWPCDNGKKDGSWIWRRNTQSTLVCEIALSL